MKGKGIYIAIVLSIFTLCILAEAIWSWRRKKNVYSAKETASNVFIFAGIHAVRPIAFAYKIALFTWVSSLKIWTIPNTFWTLLAAIVFVDFLYYWMHRLNHEISLLWTIHNVHHSSPWMNLTTALRLNWMNFLFAPFFFLPALLIGFSIQYVLVFFLLNLFFQFFLHTESIGKIPYLEGWLNTPSAHRAHHGSNPMYIDKNYGGILIIWDRIFGTYQEEIEDVQYGVTTGFMGHNPFRAIFGPLWNYLRGEFKKEKENIPASKESPQHAESMATPSTHPLQLQTSQNQP